MNIAMSDYNDQTNCLLYLLLISSISGSHGSFQDQSRRYSGITMLKNLELKGEGWSATEIRWISLNASISLDSENVDLKD
jgi:hypothetical protein